MALAALRGSFRPMAMASPFQRVTSAAPSVAQMPAAINPATPGLSTSAAELLLSGLMLVKRTFRPNVLKRKRVHGFLARLADRHGRKVLARRREKGRKILSA